MATTNSPAALVDTNVLIYAADSSSPQHARAKALRDEVEAGHIDGVVSAQVLFEFYSLITSNRVAAPRAPAQASAEVQALASAFRVLSAPDDLVDRVASLVATVAVKGPEIFDLAIAATALAHGITTIYSYDAGVFGRVDGLTTIAP